MPAPPAAAPARPAPPVDRSQAVIDVQDLRKVYPDGTAAVRGVSFQVRRGEIFGFLGPNGAGKTTTMRMLGTLHAATSGRASILGYDVQKQGRQVRHNIGFAMQEVGMDDLATAMEMLVLHGRLYGMPKAEAKAKAEELLKTFDLVEHKDRRVTRFSGGMQRRLDLAVSLVHTPQVLILDEPSTGLDPKSRADLWGVLRRLRSERGITILMSTHYMEEADALCDRIAVINKGVISAIDTPQNLKRSVGADRVRITLAAGLDARQWATLQEAFGPQHVSRDGDHIDIRVKDGARALLPALRIVADAGVQVRETKVMTPTLDDVFHKYTGTRLDDAAAQPAAPAKGKGRA